MSSFVFLVPFLSGLGLTALLCKRWRRGALWAALAGVGLAVGLVLWIYFQAPPAGAPDGCDFCGDYLGRAWAPQLVALLVGGAYVSWLAGVAIGAALAARRRRA
jgi:hypothetical protein